MSDENTKMGRPRIPLDWDKIEKMAAIFCTQEEIADIYECSIDTLNRHCKDLYGITFAEYLRQKRAHGKKSLRRRQYLKAVDEGDRVMLIWLGKQYLGQSDEQSEIKKSSIDLKDEDGNL